MIYHELYKICKITLPQLHGVDISIIFLFYKEMETPQFAESVTLLITGENGIQNHDLRGMQKKNLVGKTCAWTAQGCYIRSSQENHMGSNTHRP